MKWNFLEGNEITLHFKRNKFIKNWQCSLLLIRQLYILEKGH